MAKNEMVLYKGMACGVKVSKYGLEHGYLDYKALGEIIGAHILNNTIRQETYGWDIIHGDYDGEVFQDYIISEHGYEMLREFTDELVFYNEDLNLYLWEITHFGTAWEHVLTDVKLIS